MTAKPRAPRKAAAKKHATTRPAKQVEPEVVDAEIVDDDAPGSALELHPTARSTGLAPRAVGDTIYLQLLRPVTGYGAAGDTIQLLESLQTEAMVTNGLAVVVTSPTSTLPPSSPTSQRFQPFTHYPAGYVLINPSGQLAQANADFVSTASYSAANWTIINDTGSAGGYDGGIPTAFNPNAILPKRGTAAQWTFANPVLGTGEEGMETDTRRRKRGDGATAWTSLPYLHDSYAAAAPLAAANVTKGLYARSRPTPDLDGGGVGHPIRMFAKDPNQAGANGTGRGWAQGLAFSQLVLTDNPGAVDPATVTRSVKAAMPITGLSVQDIVFSNNWMWFVLATTASQSGSIWRVPCPGANGNPGNAGTDTLANSWNTTIAVASNGVDLATATEINVVNANPLPASGWIMVNTTNGLQFVKYTTKATATKLTGLSGGGTGTMATGGMVTLMQRMLDLSGMALGPAGGAASGGVNSTFRVASFDVAPDESAAIVTEYGAANVAFQRPTLTDGVIAPGGIYLISASGTACVSDIGLGVTVHDPAGGADQVFSILEVIQEGGGGATNPAIWRLKTPNAHANMITGGTVTFPNTTYSPGLIPGGPTAYVCSNIGAADPTTVVWTVARQFHQAKHAHAGKVHSSKYWVGLGDMAPNYKDCGIWTADIASPTNWTKRTSNTEGGVTKDPINFRFVTGPDGREVAICESDNGLMDGPLLHDDGTGTKTRVLSPTCKMPSPYRQTQRSLAIDPVTLNAYWVGTGEAGAAGPASCEWMARWPYSVPICLEDVGTDYDSETLPQGVLIAGCAWRGTWRTVVEKLIGQA